MEKELTLYNAYMECSRLFFWWIRNPDKEKEAWPGWEKYNKKYGNRKSSSPCPCCDYKVRSVVDGMRLFHCIDCLPGLWSAEPDDNLPCIYNPSSPFYEVQRHKRENKLKIARFSREAARKIKEATDGQ